MGGWGRISNIALTYLTHLNLTIYLDIRLFFWFLVDSWERGRIVTHTPTYLAQIKDNNTKTTPH